MSITADPFDNRDDQAPATPVSANVAKPRPAASGDGDCASNHSDYVDQCRRTLRLWLQWNSAHQQATQQLFKRRSPRQIEEHLDNLDRLRRQAVASSRELLDTL